MSSFRGFFNEDFLLSSTLKPKVANNSEKIDKNVNIQQQNPEKNTRFDHTFVEPPSKRACITPTALISPPNLNLKPNTLMPPTDANKNNTNNTSNSVSNSNNIPPQAFSDQILQVRIKLQIYQKEYAHFVECANRSSLQIQETLEELHQLLNLNFDFEGTKFKGNASQDCVEIVKPTLPEITEKPVPVSTPATIPPKIEFGIAVLSVKHRPRAFPRKPRCLTFNSVQSSFSNLMFTSSLDGSIQLWSKKDQKIQSSIYLPSTLNKPYFVEDLCWDRQASGLLALGLCESANAPINDDSNGPNSSRSEHQLAFLQFNTQNPTGSPKFIVAPQTPHDRSISVIESWSSTESYSDFSNFLTGGLDKAIFSWKVVHNGQSDPEISVHELHRRHTSSVQAICYDWTSQDIWSGGTDCRLIQWNNQENRIVNELRWESRISHLIKCKNESNLMLASVMAMSSQLRLFDCRNNSVVHSFGIQETANLSRYVRPSWHSNGYLIANGTLSPTDTVGSINIWDIRMMRNGSSSVRPVKMINCDDRRLVRAEFAPDGLSLVGMSTDGSLTFVDFSQ